MICYEFNLLEINNKIETVNQHCVYLDNYIIKYEKFNFYAIKTFFVEVCYNSLENKISGIKSFRSANSLNRYSNTDGLLE
jgi:hypothetical protein